MMEKSRFNEKGTSGTLLNLKIEFSKELTEILEFWSVNCVDEEHGGFMGVLDHFGKAVQNANKGCILNARILWTFSAAYRVTGKESYKEMADRAFAYIKAYFWDEKNGGLYWELNYAGQPVNTKKQAYVQGFGIYGFSEYFRATGNEESFGLAKELFDILEEKFWESKFGGYVEALTENWMPLDDMRLSRKDLNAPKSMNTHLHILEPYSNLYRVWPNARLKTAIASLLQIFCQRIYNAETKHFDMFFTNDWKTQFHEVSFGHDIEGAWLLNEASMLINNNRLGEQVKTVSRALIQSTRSEGLDADGSLFYERHGAKLDKDKHWWPQAEAMVGFMEAYELDGHPDDLNEVIKLWGFIKNYIKDEKNGEWFWRVDENRKPIESDVKAGFWKCPYHNSRAMIELMERINKIIEGK